MTDTEVIDRLAERDGRGRVWAWVFAGLALGGVVLLAVAYFLSSSRIDVLESKADANALDAQALAAQVKRLGGVPVVQPPDVDDPDPDDPERQDPELQESEQQDPEVQDPELQDPEIADDERDDPDPDDPEIQDEETQDPEVDDEPVPGPPPAGWTWVDGDGRTQSCTRDGGTDAAPHYSCTGDPPPETVPRLPIGE